ncbi:MAG TPA: helix-turn-helix domain-containing protein [Microthrixaceae bacterium]|nr:helix-turn-helix domain-containing protein [Microthrixaceae bacterium]
MSSQIVDAPRRHLSERQADTVARLVEATVAELREVAYDALTVRNVARRAGVAPATAYTYFSSKEHLVSEVFWRRLDALPAPIVEPDRPAHERAAQALGAVTMLVADEPALASACTTAMLGTDPDVRVLRDRIGASLHHRFATALEGVADDADIRVIDLVLSGAMVQAGMGHLRYEDMDARLEELTRRLFPQGSRASEEMSVR